MRAVPAPSGLALALTLLVAAGASIPLAHAQKQGDTTPPTVRFDAPAENATIDAATTIVVQAADDVGVAEVRLHIDGTLVDTLRRMQTRDAPGEQEYTFRLNASWLTAGPRSLRADAVDDSGNVGSATLHVTVAGPDVGGHGAGAAEARDTPSPPWLAVTALVLALAFALAFVRRRAP